MILTFYKFQWNKKVWDQIRSPCGFFSISECSEGCEFSFGFVRCQPEHDTRLLSQTLWRRTHVGHQPSIRANEHCHLLFTAGLLEQSTGWEKEVKEGSTQTLRFAWQGRISYPSFPQQQHQHARMPLYDAGSSRTALEGKFGNFYLQLSWGQWMRVMVRLQSASSHNLIPLV